MTWLQSLAVFGPMIGFWAGIRYPRLIEWNERRKRGPLHVIEVDGELRFVTHEEYLNRAA